MTARQDLGAFGERVAGHRLEASGLRILVRNVRTPGGEIDIVAAEGDETVFVEVRTRRADPGSAAESLGPAKLRRMWQCAMDYCEASGVNPERVRIDVISVDLGPGGTVAQVEHFRGVEIPD
ncbi:MAG: YraN family protein [Chloroflexi bacterium]|nr:YraN family protein [Chloroflexota bacterium]